jgi:hypothetical protein
MFTTGRFNPGAHNAYELRLPTVTGVYVIRLDEITGLQRTVKVIVK